MNTATNAADADFCYAVFTASIQAGHAPSLGFRAAASALLAVRGALTLCNPVLAADAGIAAVRRAAQAGVPENERWAAFVAAVCS